MVAALADPIEVGGTRTLFGVSVGIDASSNSTLDEQLSAADAALYRAKHDGRGRVEVA